jgi:prepilin-type N-terminal cleavage/methylation domain-containing protein
MTRHSSISRRRAFTLVELLVVIAIIAVLVSMLLPALNRARSHAMAVQCLSQQKQVMAALLLYAHDNQGVIPAANYDSSSNAWFRNLQGQNDSIEYIKYPGSGKINPVLLCPRGNFRRQGAYGLYDPNSRYPQEPSYLRIVGAPGVVRFKGFKLARIQRNTDFLLLGCTSITQGSGTFDCDQGSYVWFSYREAAPGGGATPAGLWAAHLNMVNGIFADGHGERMDAGRLLGTSNVNGNTTAAGFPSNRSNGVSWWKNENFTINNY